MPQKLASDRVLDLTQWTDPPTSHHNAEEIRHLFTRVARVSNKSPLVVRRISPSQLISTYGAPRAHLGVQQSTAPLRSQRMGCSSKPLQTLLGWPGHPLGRGTAAQSDTSPLSNVAKIRQIHPSEDLDNCTLSLMMILCQ